jgi:hypothetical protein
MVKRSLTASVPYYGGLAIEPRGRSRAAWAAMTDRIGAFDLTTRSKTEF